jgi:FdhE protein
MPALKLFHALSAIGQQATQRMGAEIPKITGAAKTGALDLNDLLKRQDEAPYISHEAERCGLDKGILAFLVRASVRPSLEAQREQLQDSLSLEAWLRGQCPLCGSPPQMAQLQEEEGKRYLRCSFCGCQWRGEGKAIIKRCPTLFICLPVEGTGCLVMRIPRTEAHGH